MMSMVPPLAPSVAHRPYRVAVVGAGAAGAACASRLLQHGGAGLRVRVFDMGARGPGGRACSRPVDGRGASFSPEDQGGGAVAAPGLVFDHGLQAVQPTTPAVRAAIDAWVAAGLAAEWRGRFGTLEGGVFREAPSTDVDGDGSVFDGLSDQRPRFVGTPSGGAWVGGLLPADDPALELRWQTKVEAVEWVDAAAAGGDGCRWRLRAGDESWAADVVVCAGHAASLVADAAQQLPPPLRRAAEAEGAGAVGDAALRAVSYPDGVAPLYALMVRFATPLLPWDGAAVRGDEALRWVSRQSSMPGRADGTGGEVVVALSTERFAARMAARPSHARRASEAHLQEAAAELLAALRRALGGAPLPPTTYVHAQRWAAGLTRAPLGLRPPCAAWAQGGLVGCGEWAAAPPAGFEQALLSGWAAADAVGAMRTAAAANAALLSVARATPAQAAAAAAWPVWSCAAWADGAHPAGRFQESRWWEARPGVGEERCHVFAGRATLLPEGGGAPIEIGAGDWVVFRKGFACEWVVTEPISKRYGYYRADGGEWAPPPGAASF